MMKKCVSLCLVLLMLCAAAFAESAPVDVKLQSVRGNASFTRESYDTVWITPIFDEHIVTKTNEEKYPAKFIKFPAPEGYTLTEYSYDESSFINFDILVGLYYYAYDKASFELFLEKAVEEEIIKDGSDGTAIYIEPDARRVRAMVSLKDQFGGTSKLTVILDDYSRDLGTDELLPMMEEELARIAAEMTVEQPGHFWTEGKFNSIEIQDGRNPASAIMDVSGLLVTRFSESKITTLAADGRNANDVQIEMGSYSYAHSKLDEGDKDAKQATLENGMAYVCYSTEYSSHAGFLIYLDEEEERKVYLTIRIECAPDEFPAALEAIYERFELFAEGMA